MSDKSAKVEARSHTQHAVDVFLYTYIWYSFPPKSIELSIFTAQRKEDARLHTGIYIYMWMIINERYRRV